MLDPSRRLRIDRVSPIPCPPIVSARPFDRRSSASDEVGFVIFGWLWMFWDAQLLRGYDLWI
jgi:hypothetical protein